jgi:hypothetical protein
MIALSRIRSRFAQYKVRYLWDEWETYFVDVPRTIQFDVSETRSVSVLR